MPRARRRRRGLSRRATATATVVVLAALAVGGCGQQSILNTHSPQAHNIMLLWWWMLAASAIVFFGSVGMLAIAVWRRKTPGAPFLKREETTEGLVIVFGIAIPVVALVALFAVANLYLVNQTSPPPPQTTAMTINVIGHQWWWEVRYPGTSAITANEIHIPERTRVNVVATTADVIHSFWVPALNRKIDMIPGRMNRILLYASQPGTYRGQCSQFCGFQHAHMSLYVFAQTPTAFRAWLANMASKARVPSTPAAQTGYHVFMNDQCASCHYIAGTPAQGFVGPDLTHLATRTTLAALTIPNTPKYLAAWITNPQAIKPGTRMPDLGLSPTEVSEVVAYLETLK